MLQCINASCLFPSIQSHLIQKKKTLLQREHVLFSDLKYDWLNCLDLYQAMSEALLNWDCGILTIMEDDEKKGFDKKKQSI